MNKIVVAFPHLIALAMAMPQTLSAADPAGTAESVVTYEQVQPVFKKHCVGCHGIERERGDLNLSSIEGINAGSASGPVVMSGKPEESLAYTLAAHLETPRMPPGKSKIPQRELDLIRNWIEGGLQHRTKPVAAVAPKATAGPSSQTKQPPASNGSPPTDVIPLPRHMPITALAVNPKDGTVVVSGLRQALVFADTAEPPVAAIPFPEGEIFALRFSRDGRWMLIAGGTGAESGKVVVVDVETGKRLFEVGNESDVVLAFDVTSDRSLIALGGPGRIVKIYRTTDGELVSTLRKHTDWILSIAFSPDGLLLASSDRFGAVQVWEAHSGRPFHSLRGHTGAVSAIDWSTTSEKLVSGGQDGMLRVWDMHHGVAEATWNSQVGGVLSVIWTKAGLIVAGGRNKHVAIFDSPDQLKKKWSLTDEVLKVASSADGAGLITGDASGNVAAWSIERGESIGTFAVPIKSHGSQVEPPLAPRKARAIAVRSPNPAIDDDPELKEVRDALTSTEAAIKAAEESLARLKTTSDALRQLIASREAARKQAKNPPK